MGKPDGEAAQFAISFDGIGKNFTAIRALHDVDLDLGPAMIHAFVGENGAGKSTCLGILAGRIAPTRGTVHLWGKELHCGDPRLCRQAGVVSIYQELTIVPALSAHANVFLGLPLSRGGFVSERRMRAKYLGLCAEIDVDPAPPNVAAGKLSVAEQQLLEIMRALVADAQIILLDEPTASLAMHERDALLRLMCRLRETGRTIVFVSHNLDEVLQIADTVTVFRDGCIAAHAPRSHWDKAKVVREMLGDDIGSQLIRAILEQDSAQMHDHRPMSRDGVEPLLRVEGLTVPGAIRDVDLEVYPGEILGIGGLVGSGRTTILRALAGLEPRAVGRLWVDGRRRPIPRTVPQARKLGIALVPEDRKTQGLVLGMDAMNNIALGNLRSFSRLRVISRRRMAKATSEAAAEVGFHPDRIGVMARNLSGGNQQKLLLARWRLDPPRVLLADEPTRGIDIGAKAEVMTSLRKMASSGMGVVVVSSELEEISALSDRVIVLAEGSHVGTLDRSEAGITPSSIMALAFGLTEA